MSLLKIISGGQTGADIAALRIAKERGFQTGGWMPRGCKTLDGPRPEYIEEYGVHEMSTSGYKARTFRNVYDSDGTLRIAHDFSSAGEICTAKAIYEYERPSLDVKFEWIHDDPIPGIKALKASIRPNDVALWLTQANIQVLNVAGNSGKWFEPYVETYFEQVLLSYQRRGLVAV